jgi:hypothetical protein
MDLAALAALPKMPVNITSTRLFPRHLPSCCGGEALTHCACRYDMLVIRKEQFDKFRAQAMRVFEAEMSDHLREFSPPLCQTLSDEQLLAAVRYGIARAEKNGFDMRGPVRLWLENALVFGSDFDTDPQYPWAAEIIGNLEMIQMHRAESLFEKTVDYRRTVGGERDAHTVEALERIRPFAAGPLPFASQHLSDHLRSAMATIFPEKAAYLGNQTLKALIDVGLKAAKQRGITELRGQVLVVTLMYAFGHGCLGDPLYPWIERTLSDTRIGDANARAARLERKALVWLDHVLAHFGAETPA